MKILPFIIITILAISSCGEQATTVAPKTASIRLVEYGTIQLLGNTQVRTYSGTTQSTSETRLSFRTGGLITELKTDVGQQVKKGQLLAILDQTDIQLNYDKALATEKSAAIQLETSKSNLDRLKKLYLSNSASLSDYENEKNNYATALYNYESAKKSLQLQQSQFEYSKIIAPNNGVISEVNVEQNEYAQAGATIFVFNTNNSKMEANVGVPEKQITKIQEGQSVDISIGDLKLKGTVTGVSYSTSGTSTYPVIVSLGRNKNIRPGMPCRVSFKFNAGEDKPQLIAPIKSISENAEGSFAYALIKSESGDYYTAEKRNLELGPINDEGFVVIAGLKEGDLVATAGLRSIIDGIKVRLLNE